MRAPVEWIREYVEFPESLTIDELVAAYVRVGLEVEDVHVVPASRGPLVIGKILQIEELTEFKKPIRFATVDVGAGNGPDGSDAPRQIICGAQNFQVGDAVVISLPGAVLPGEFEIAARKTYGHISDGMICSARELGIGEDHDGILVLDPTLAPGTDAREIIGGFAADDPRSVASTVIEFSITPDRGYTLSIRGLARELAAALDVRFTDPADRPVREAATGTPVEICDTERCVRFVAVDIAGVDPAAPSPWWMRRRLLAAGIRAISLAVDVTNYVMIELGHPLHAFDSDQIAGGIRVRRAVAGEKLRTLDHSDRVLTDDDVVVADHGRALSIAGVMGGEDSEISASTTNVVIEAASWNPSSISRTVRRQRLPSEAARRYERAVDPALSAVAAERAAALLVSSGGGHLGGRTDVGHVPATPQITLPQGEASRLAGKNYTVEAMARRLEQVGCLVQQPDRDDQAGAFLVTPPSWRPDVTRPADLVEEIARLEGYDEIDSILPVATAAPGLTSAQRRRRRVASDLAAAGLTEVISFPFMGSHDLDALGIDTDDARRRATRLLNPLDRQRPLMATTLLPGLITTVQRNLSRGAKDLAVYEVGQVVRPDAATEPVPVLGVDRRPSDDELAALLATVPAQPVHVALVISGRWERDGWWGHGRMAQPSDVFELARRIGEVAGTALTLSAAAFPPWHPGRCAEIRALSNTDGDAAGALVGHAGELHPAVVERLDLPARSVALEIDLSAFSDAEPPIPPAVSPFPPVHMDVALVVPASTPAAAVTDVLASAGGPLLESVRLFDVYDGDQIAAGYKSLAAALVIRAAGRTLTAAEAADVRDLAVAAVADRFGAELRG